MAPTCQVEPFSKVWPEAQELIQLHWAEIARDKDVIPLAPALKQYERVEDMGQLQVVTVRQNGALIGYHASFIKPHMHYETSLTAFTDLYYVHPSHRLGRTAMRMFLAVEEEWRQRGVQRAFASCKLEHDLMPLFLRLGWAEIERGFSKRIKI